MERRQQFSSENAPDIQRERESTPPILYREAGIGELFSLWREKQLTPKRFSGSPQSSLKKGEHATFWFDKPAALSGGSFSALLQLRIGEMRNPPKVAQGRMSFKSQSANEYWGSPMRSVEEYYIKEVIPLKDIRCFVNEDTASDDVLRGLAHLLKYVRSGKKIEIDKENPLLLQSPSEQELGEEYEFFLEGYDFLENVYKEAFVDDDVRDNGQIRISSKERARRFALFVDGFTRFMHDVKNIALIQDFCRWLRKNPQIEPWDVPDYEDKGTWDFAVQDGKAVQVPR